LVIIEGSLEVKLPTIWTDEKQSREEAERRERLEERRVEEKESEETDARKGRKVAKHCFS
jgi:tetrahydromethanopterin S-methyltransferase subunit G